MTIFDEFPESDDLDATLKAPVDPKRQAQAKAAEDAGAGFVEKCPKCRGRFISYGGRDMGACFTCKGAGTRTFKTSTAQRAQARATATQREERTEQLKVDAFAEAHPAEWAWISRNFASFEFAQKMGDAVRKYADLTDNQMGAIHKCMQRDTQRAVADKARAETAQVVNMEALEQAFTKARNGLKNPKLRLPGFVVSLAKAHSKNPGALYLKSDQGEYIGKVHGGKFFCSRECGPELEQKVLATLQDPKGQAIEYGRLTGACACCGRALTDPESVQRGIGPICAENYGW